ncbi:MAG: hypothetical protein P1P88_04715 [Bacteroidales bacterium]|nr:hypothetical protein [Bacteroidales bacterium]
MEAKNAREISEKNKLGIEGVLKNIEAVANSGHDTLVCSNLHQDAINFLMELGYKISIFRDPYNGLKNHFISWE